MLEKWAVVKAIMPTAMVATSKLYWWYCRPNIDVALELREGGLDKNLNFSVQLIEVGSLPGDWTQDYIDSG